MKMYIKSNKYPDSTKIKDAMKFLDSVDYGKVVLVKECRSAILDLYADPSDGIMVHDESGVIRDFKSIAAEEWDDLSVEEADKLFDDILNALDIINADEAAAWT